MPRSKPISPAGDTAAETFWNSPRAALFSELDASERGLAQAQADERLARTGGNVVRDHRERRLVVQFLSRFLNPLVALLLVASAVSAFTGDIAGFVIIVGIILISVTLDFVQEYQAGKAVEKLRKSVATQVRVLRDGQTVALPSDQLAPGDVVLLAAGELVPADGRVIEASDFFVNQAQLTGEPYPVEKHARELDAATADMAQATNAVFMGSSVISGSARVLLCRTGSHSALGGIAQSLSGRALPTAFDLGVRQFGLMIMRVTIAMALFVLLTNVFFHRPMLDSFLFAMALAVGLTPELLPMVVTVTMARGGMRMARQQVIVKQMAAIQNLGSMDVLCTDKTGTLTEAKISLLRHVDVAGRDSDWVFQLAYLNSYFETGLRSPLDEAIIEHDQFDASGWQKIDEVPFDFERRRVSVLVDDDKKRILVVKGAPEDVLRLSTHYAPAPDTAPLPLDDARRAEIRALHDSLAADGFRLLGIALGHVPPEHQHAKVTDESDMIFAGFAVFLDPPKPSAAPALAALAASGVAIKVVTGDNELVSRHICKAVGLEVTGLLTGDDIHELDDHALAARVDQVNLFCRVTPSQKNRVILALKSRGHTVGYLGDGINDAPSLHAADVGISVDSAVDVAKEAAGMILLKQDLGVLHEGVLEGRRTAGNVMKYILMGTSSNFGNMFSMAGAALFLPFLPMLPLQVLLNNLLYDLSEITIPLDRVDDAYLAQPRHWDMAFIRRFMLVIGPVSSLFDFLTFYVMLQLFHAGEAWFHTGWFVESIATQVLVIFVIRTRGNAFKSRPAMALAATSLLTVLVAALLPYLPFAPLLGFTPLPASFMAVIAAMVAVYLVLVELVKRAFYARLGMR
ncbi:magnesium-translocating P-type ATPase [Chitinivorax sp. PXF-14]|uniref:magnesium-translocating P-type ATPase n=1 Tax=Chitinivorax sp. PXF-14 TaxID=3230488 RepID=UPI003466A960